MTARNAVAWLLRLLGAAVLLTDAANGQIISVPPVRTVATLGSCVDGKPKMVAVTDGASSTDCSAGGGVLDLRCCCENGSWAACNAGSGGTVTTVSVATANGVSGTVANATTTPAITVALGAITPTSVAASGNVTGSNLSGTNTGDQTNISGNAATATALQSTLGVDGGGTGATSLTAYAPLCGGTTTTGAVQSCGTGQSNTGYVWTSNGDSALPSWQAAAGGGSPGGSDMQVQFNDSGSFGGDNGLTYDKTADALTIVTLKVSNIYDATSTNSLRMTPSPPRLTASGGGFDVWYNTPSGTFSTFVTPVTNAHDLWVGGVPNITTYDLTPGVVGLWGIAAAAAASTHLVGGMAVCKGGDGASGSSGDAHGGDCQLDGGRGYGTGHDGQIVIGSTRGNLRINDPGTKPTCSATYRGAIWVDYGGAGVADTFEVCGKSAADSYSWVAAATF